MHTSSGACESKCYCKVATHSPKLIVITGGPGAGKTAVLEMARKNFCQHVAVLPEAASIIFGGGFWRLDTDSASMAAQRAIFHVQRELEQMVLDDANWAMGLCDRGTLDGLAYWPAQEELYWQQVGSGPATELSRYQAVVHLRTPSLKLGYNHTNTLRIESPQEARAIDQRIEKIWSAHPRYVQIDSSIDFIDKARLAIQAIEGLIPECCRLPA